MTDQSRSRSRFRRAGMPDRKNWTGDIRQGKEDGGNETGKKRLEKEKILPHGQLKFDLF